VRGDTLQAGRHPSKINKSDSDEQKRSSVMGDTNSSDATGTVVIGY